VRVGLITVIGLIFLMQRERAYAQKEHIRHNMELPQEAQYYSDSCADHWNVPRELMRAIMYQESGGRANIVSKINKERSRNGQGLMQLLPSTAAYYGVTDTFSPGDNACGGAHFLSDLIKEFGDLREVVAAYYCGQHHIRRKGLKYSNPAVVAYVKSVRSLYIEELRKEGLYDDVALR